MLEKYNGKRNFQKTKEPIGKKEKEAKHLRFTIQHHLARKDHYDLRLEWKGVMISFAIPEGPSYNALDKRLAIHVEDHPISYRNFEGTIPKGNYGAGVVMLFDKGYWEPLKPPNLSSQIKFTLKGQRLKGAWNLIHFKENNWLLIKEKDNYLNYTDITKYKTSIKTNRTMEEIKNHEKKKEKNLIDAIDISSPDKIIFPKQKITKLDLAKYYEKVAYKMLPYLQNRIISTLRAPHGINGKMFFKKHLEESSEGVGHINLPSKKGDYYYIKNILGILYEVQMNGFEFHTWNNRVYNLNKPDIMVFDLDPDPSVSLKRLRQGAKDLKSILDEYHLTSFLKTSGKKGYHIVVPFHSIKNYQEFTSIAKTIAKLMVAKWPDKYVSNIRKKNRKNKIFIDWIRNTLGSTTIAPYSVRLSENPTVSMPIRWDELDKIKPDEITIQEAIKRLRKKDPWQNFFDINQ